MVRQHPLFAVVVGAAAALYGAARLLVERLEGASPWTPRAFTAVALLVLGCAVAGLGVARWRKG